MDLKDRERDDPREPTLGGDLPPVPEGPRDDPSSRRLLGRWPRLPLMLLAAMVVIGLVLEQTVYGAPRWLPKLPLLSLFTLLALRRRTGSGGLR